MMQDNPTPARPEVSLEEFLDSLTGYDEIAITQAFGRVFAVLCEDPTMLARAAIFVHQRRGGQTDAQAKATALTMPMREVNGFFPDAEEEIDPTAPETPEGEDDSQPA